MDQQTSYSICFDGNMDFFPIMNEIMCRFNGLYGMLMFILTENSIWRDIKHTMFYLSNSFENLIKKYLYQHW